MFLLSLLACAPLSLTAGAVGAPDDPLIVHEWGTFTSMQGSDGVVLEGMQHEEERLPHFVYSRTEVRECPFRKYGYKGLEVPVENVTQKMETPVIYFHSETERRLKVRVDFVDGLLTQWYPVSDRLGPEEKAMGDGPLDLTEVERSFLEWEIDLIPNDRPAPSEIYPVDEGDPWALARDVDSAFVRTVPRNTTIGRVGPTEAENYLFYRGLGTFELPLTVAAGADGEGRLDNDGEQALPAVFALEIRGETGRWMPLGGVGPGESRGYDLGPKPLEDKAAVVAALKDAVQTSLEAQGLYGDEAAAMVATWSRQWFGTEGSRLIYLVPRAITDGLLPLSIEPAPDELVRVLVGRLEYLTPEVEARTIEALKQRIEGADEATRDAAFSWLMARDRFLEPHLRRAIASSEDPVVRQSALDLLVILSPGE